MKYIHIKVCYDKNAVFADTKDANVLRTQTPMCHEHRHQCATNTKARPPPPINKTSQPQDILGTY